MGAEASNLVPGDYQCDDQPVQSWPDYSLYNCQDAQQSPLSLFLAQDYTEDGSLDKLSLRLKQYRHPNILHFISSSRTKRSGCLVTERVSPLCLSNTNIEEESVCLGLLELCQALGFLHQAGLCHANISQGSVFVTAGGRWRLGGLEFSVPATPGGLAKDVQAFGLMVTELLANCQLEESKKFTEFAKTTLLLPDIRRIPSVEEILKNDYFSQTLPDIFKFLTNFPIQLSEARAEFFKSLSSRLASLPASVVGRELVPALLTRYMMLEPLAHHHLIPHLLTPAQPQSILPLPQYLSYVVPQLRLLLMVPDTTVRLTLLSHLPNIVTHLDQDTLTEFLPFLLQGMRDTDPAIVSSTLRCLADLVPILGPEVVVGANRTKIFSDRSPIKQRKVYCSPPPLQISPSKKVEEKLEKNSSVEDVGDAWDDWTEEEEEKEEKKEERNITEKTDDNEESFLNQMNTETLRGVDITSNVAKLLKNVEDLDIMKLDIKVSKTKSDKLEDIDFFADMTPQITRKVSSLDKFEAQLKSDSELQPSLIVSFIMFSVQQFKKFYSLRISSLWRLRMAATMKMMDGEKKSGEALRASYKVNCEKYLPDHYYHYCAMKTTHSDVGNWIRNKDHLLCVSFL